MDIELSEAEKIKILNSDDLYSIMQKILLRENKIDRNREHFWVVGLETTNRILFIELISLGSVNKTLAEPMEVFSFALQKRAVKIILVHNHPSGELTPSSDDKDLTDRLIQVGRIVRTPVLDHLIISERSFLSFLDIGLLDELKESMKWVPGYEIEEKIRKRAGDLAKEKLKEKAKKEVIKVAKNMKSEGLEINLIAKLTGLTVAEVEKIKV